MAIYLCTTGIMYKFVVVKFPEGIIFHVHKFLVVQNSWMYKFPVI